MLESHKRIGKRLVPPLSQLGPWKEVSWVDEALPELLWIGLLNAEYGIERGAHVCAEVTKAAKPELELLDQNAFLCLASSFELFGQDHLVRIRRRLESAHVLADLQVAVSPLCVAYPECPLAGLVRGVGDLERATAKIRRTLSSLLDRWDEPATFVQIHAVYTAFLQGRLFVTREISLANFPAVEAYPHTEESRQIASACRSTVNMLLKDSPPHSATSWSGYFWNRGLELEKCGPLRPAGES